MSMRPLRSLAPLALVAVLAGPAEAAPAEDASPAAIADAWAAATADAKALRLGDHEAAERCGAAFHELHVALPPDHPRAAEALYNAARCHEAAGQWGAAAGSYQRVVQRWPGERLADAALERLADGHRAIGRYAEAAEFAEQYAARNPKDKRTPDLLRDAYELRRGLGQRDRALAVLDRLTLLYGRSDPQRAATIFWQRRELLAPDEQLAHAEAYLKLHGKTGPRDLMIVATAWIGEHHWRAACTRDLLDDLCMRIAYTPAQASGSERDRAHELRRRGAAPHRPSPAEPPTCRDDKTPRMLIVDPRDRTRAAEARKWLTTALQLARRDPPKIAEDDVRRRRVYEAAVARTAVHLADADLEQLLAVELPRGLTFADDQGDPRRRRAREDSVRRFKEYYERTSALSRALEQQYAEVQAGFSPAARIVALLRLGQLAEYTAAGLLRGELPREVRDPPVVAAYCATMHEQVAPLRQAAVTAYARCLELSSTSGEFTDASRACERALHHHDPRKWPATPELLGAAQYTATRPDTVGVVLESPQLDPAPAD